MNNDELDVLYEKYNNGIVSWNAYCDAVRNALHNINERNAAMCTNLEMHVEELASQSCGNSMLAKAIGRCGGFQEGQNAIEKQRRKQIDAISVHIQRVNSVEGRICVRCHRPITKARLDAVPETNVCAKCVRPDIDEEEHDLIESIYTNEKIPAEVKQSLLNKQALINRTLKNTEIEASKKLKEAEEKARQLEQESRLKILEEQKKIEEEREKINFVTKQNEEIFFKKIFIENLIAKLKNCELVIFANESKYNERSPDLKGILLVNKTKYEIVLWKNIGNCGETYFLGYININTKEQNYMQYGKIFLRKYPDNLHGKITTKKAQYVTDLQKRYEKSIEFGYWFGSI